MPPVRDEAPFQTCAMMLGVVREGSQHPTPALEREAGGAFTRKEVCRLLKVEPRQLRSWERQRLIPELSQYKFRDLLRLKRLVRLRKEKANPRLLKQALHTLDGYLKDSPELSEDVQVYTDGRRVRIQIGRQNWKRVQGRFLFDFAEEEISKLLQLPGATEQRAAALRKNCVTSWRRTAGLSTRWNWSTAAPNTRRDHRGLSEGGGAGPQSAGALVNLGTVFFNGHAWADAEAHYKSALEIDPRLRPGAFQPGESL